MCKCARGWVRVYVCVYEHMHMCVHVDSYERVWVNCVCEWIEGYAPLHMWPSLYYLTPRGAWTIIRISFFSNLSMTSLSLSHAQPLGRATKGLFDSQVLYVCWNTWVLASVVGSTLDNPNFLILQRRKCSSAQIVYPKILFWSCRSISMMVMALNFGRASVFNLISSS